MKKIFITIAIVLGMTLCASAQKGGGLFQLGAVPNEECYNAGSRYDEGSIMNFQLPDAHGQTNDQNAPVGSGALLLIGFGAAYALKQRKAK